MAVSVAVSTKLDLILSPPKLQSVTDATLSGVVRMSGPRIETVGVSRGVANVESDYPQACTS